MEKISFFVNIIFTEKVKTISRYTVPFRRKLVDLERFPKSLAYCSVCVSDVGSWKVGTLVKRDLTVGKSVHYS
jgi:hypothetical protein